MGLFNSYSLIIKREKFRSILVQFGIPKKLVQLVRIFLSDPISRVRIGNNMSNSFKIRSGLKQDDPLSALPFNFALEYAILKIKEHKKLLSLNDLNQLSVYAKDLYLIGEDIDVLRSNINVLVQACDEIDPQVNTDKTKYMIISRNTENNEKGT